MKGVGIGDLYIPGQFIHNAFKDNSVFDEFKTVEWELDNLAELQNINLLIETSGCEAYKVPGYIIERVKDAEIIITQFCPINKRVIDNCNNLKIIGVLRGGYENINVDYATKKGITVCNTIGRNSNAVADFTVGMILAECKNIARAHAALKNNKWRKEFSNSSSIPDLPGKKVGIIGLGQIGLKVAKRLTGFGVELLGYDPFIDNPPLGIKMVELSELAVKSDFITIHMRLVKETERMIDKHFFSMMKPTSYFINTARSGLVDESALYDVLKSKKIAGAAIDVFDKEPVGKEYPLVSLDNVTVTPHLAGTTIDTYLNSPKMLANNIKMFLNNKSIKCVVNKEIL